MKTFYSFLECFWWGTGLVFGLGGLLGVFTIFSKEWYYSFPLTIFGGLGWWYSTYMGREAFYKRLELELRFEEKE